MNPPQPEDLPVSPAVESAQEVQTILLPMNPALEMEDQSTIKVQPPVVQSHAWDDFERPGAMIGRYKLLEEIGEGGFGIVWRAEQTGDVRREVALKVIKPGMDSREIIARFEAERQALAMMNHPHIAQMLEGGSTLLGRPYFAMEYVKGQPITQYCDDRKLPLEERIRIFIDVCAAVQHAHQKAILHRDLKPSNILVSENSGLAVAKVIDFGVAKALGSQLTDKTMFTQAGTAIGTPQYMSPEQAGVMGQDVDTRSDVYSLGVILYELLTGGTPLRIEEAFKIGLANLKDWLRDAEPERPSTRIGKLEQPTQLKIATNRKTEVRRLPRALRGDLDWIVMRALEKDRNRRYQTANGLALDLERYLKGDAVEAGPPSASYRLGKMAHRYRGALTAAALMLLTIFVGVGFTVWQAIRATRAEKLASQRLIQAEGARDAAEDLITEAIPGLRKQLLALGRVEVMEDMVKAADTYYKKLPPELSNEEALRHKSSLALNRALIAAALGRDEEQKEQTEESLKLTDQIALLHPEEEALQDEACYGMLSLCYLYSDRSEFDAMLSKADAMLARCDAWLVNHPKSTWAMRYQVIAHNLVAQTMVRYLNKVPEAFSRFQTAAAITVHMREVAGETADVCECEGLNHYGNAKVAQKLGNALLSIKEFEASTASFARALELGGDSALLREMHVGAMHHAGAANRDYAAKNHDTERQQHGEDLVRQALEGRKKLVELEPGRSEWWRDLAHSYTVMASIALDAKDPVAELQHSKESLRCRDEAVNRQPSRPLLYDEQALSLFGLANVLTRTTPLDNTQAADLYLRGLSAWRKGVEMSAMKSLNQRQIKNDVEKFCKIAATDPKAGAEWLSQARDILEPLADKMENKNDVIPAIGKIMELQVETLAALGRDADSVVAKAALDKLTGAKGGSVKNAAAVAKLLLDAASPEIDNLGKAKPEQIQALLTKLQGSVTRARGMLEPVVAKENLPTQRFQLGRTWWLEARLLKWNKRQRDAADAYLKALPLLGSHEDQVSFTGAQQELGDLLRDLKDIKSAVEHYGIAAKIRDEATHAENASGETFRIAGVTWTSIRVAHLGVSDLPAAKQASDNELQRYQRAIELDPLRSESQWGLASALITRVRILALLKDMATADTTLDQAVAKISELIPQLTNPSLLDSINNYLLADTCTSLRTMKNYAAAEKALLLLVAVRERLETLRSWSEDVSKTSISTRMSVIFLYLEQKRAAEIEAKLTAVLEAADLSARPAIIAATHAQARSFYDSLHRYDEAEKHSHIAYEVSQKTDLGTSAIGIASEYAVALSKLKRFSEAEKVILPVWDFVSTRTFPNELPRLRSDLAGKVVSVYSEWFNAEPNEVIKAKAIEWAERQATSMSLDAKLYESDIGPAISAWLWRMATWAEAGNKEAFNRQRTKILALAKGRPQPEYCLNAARIALLMPCETSELEAAIALAETAYKSNSKDDAYTTVQALALFRKGQHAEALAVLEPVMKVSSYDRLFAIRSIAAMAYHALGQTDKTNEIMTSIDKVDKRALVALNHPVDRSAAISRALLHEAKTSLGMK